MNLTHMSPGEFRQARLRLGLSQGEFANEFGVSLRAVHGWEAGHRNGKPQAVPKAYAALINLTLQYSFVRRALGLLEKS